MKENLKSYYNKHSVKDKGSHLVIRGNGFEISVFVYSESNVKASKKIRKLIKHDDIGLVYADPIGPVNNSEKCFTCFEDVDGLDLLLHYSENNKDRVFHNPKMKKDYKQCRTMNDLERETERKYKFTTGIISKAKQKYAFFYATNINYEVVE